MEYIIVTARSTEELQEVVMWNIAEGFRPLGGPFLTQRDSGTICGQAMTRGN